VKPVGDEVRDAIRAAAQAAEDAGKVFSRRALAREFGVSPQTVARALGGPAARRGGSAYRSTTESDDGSLAAVLVGFGLAALSVWAAWRAERNRRGGH
jgi:DNA-binding transcriptional MocR family regulator